MIELNDVTKTHLRGETVVNALRGVSGVIERGAFTFIVGPSGSGKSSLLYLIGALDDPTTGDIRVDGQSLGDMSPQAKDDYRRHRVGFIFQNFNLLSNLNAIDNVLVPFLPEGINASMRQRAVEILKSVRLSERLDHRPSQLSGGEQQRVAIARAILKKPSIILADEPTGELDSETGQEVFGYLRRLHEEEGSTVVVVTHDQRYLRESDTVWTLRDGRRVDAGETAAT